MSQMWFRMYAEAVDDEKLRLLAFEDRWHYVAILCLKSLGTLDSEAPFLERRIALKLGVQPAQLDEVKRRLIEVNLIDDDWQPVAWDKRQFKSDHDAAERKKNQRNRDRLKAVTTVSRDSHNKVTTPEQNRAEQNRAEQNRADMGAEQSSPLPAQTSEKQKRPSRRCPSDFALTKEMRDWACTECPGVDVDRETATFRDYEFRNPHSDWLGTWRNWMRRAFTNKKAPKQPASPYANAI